MWALLSLVGLGVTHGLSTGGFHRWDLGVDTWFVHHRTHLGNSITVFGSGVANTPTAVAVTAVSMLVLRWRLGRWSESWLVLAAIAGELVIFLAVTATVHRPRHPCHASISRRRRRASPPVTPQPPSPSTAA